MSNVSFCFIIKDGEDYIEKNLKKIIDFGNSYFNEYRIYYAENDSKDNTVKILENFKHNYSNIYGTHLKLDGLHSTELCKKNEINCSNRTRRLAYLRNITLNQAKKWNKCDYLIMLDIDFIDFNEFELKKMFDHINTNHTINGIFGMSKSYNIPYDVGAVKPAYKMINILYETELVKVSSAFSGFGIYRMKSIKNIEYNVNTNNIEHIDFNYNLNNLYVYTYFQPKYDYTYFYTLLFRFLFFILFIILFILLIIYKKIVIKNINRLLKSRKT